MGKPKSKPTIVIDNQEKLPLVFDQSACNVVTGDLWLADYSIIGRETAWAIERKSLADYVGSITAGRDRFFRELDELRGYEFKRIIVEADACDVTLMHYRSSVHPNSVWGTTYKIEVDFGIPVIFCGDHDQSAKWVQGILTRLWSNEQAKEVSSATGSDDIG